MEPAHELLKEEEEDHKDMSIFLNNNKQRWSARFDLEIGLELELE